MAFANSLPRGAALVYRAFGDPQALDVARSLRAITRRRGCYLFVGADEKLGFDVDADGIHLPEQLKARAGRLRRQGFWVTAAAHSAAATRMPGVDAVVLSVVFPSTSPSAGAPLGALRFSQIVRRTQNPVYALGGINSKTASRLLNSGAIGIAAVDAFRT